MARLSIHNATEGASILVEYAGTPSAVVLLNAFAVPTPTRLLRDYLLALIASQSLQGIKNTQFPAALGEVQIYPVTAVVADLNGFAHWVIQPSSAASAGTTLRAEVTTVA